MVQKAPIIRSIANTVARLDRYPSAPCNSHRHTTTTAAAPAVATRQSMRGTHHKAPSEVSEQPIR